MVWERNQINLVNRGVAYNGVINLSAK